MNELARLLDLDKSSVTGLVDRAERRGLVERAPSTADRRAVLVRLTDEGRSLVSAARRRFAEDVTAMLACCARDRAALSRLVGGSPRRPRGRARHRPVRDDGPTAR